MNGIRAEEVAVTAEALLARVDRGARKRLGMTGEEFAKRYAEDELPDTLAANELGVLLECAGGAPGRAEGGEG